MVQAILRSSGLNPRPVYRVHLAACGFRNGLSTREGYKTFSKRDIVLSSFRMPTDENPPSVCLTLRFQIAAVSRTGKEARRKIGGEEGDEARSSKFESEYKILKLSFKN